MCQDSKDRDCWDLCQPYEFRGRGSSKCYCDGKTVTPGGYGLFRQKERWKDTSAETGRPNRE